MDLIIKPNKAVLADILRQQALQVISQIEPIVVQTVDSYLDVLHLEMGGIAGDRSVVVNGSLWQPLSQPYGKNKTFWHNTGEAENALAVAYKTTKTGFQVIVGISPDSPAYNKAVWNEFGFYPQDSDKLVRRALFVPLAETHVRELNTRIRSKFNKIKITLQAKVL